MHTESIVLHIYPEQECTYCPRLTSVAITNRGQGIFSPICPLHGYVHPHSPLQVTQSEHERQFESIRRFVVWMYGEQGRVSLVSPVHNLLTIPGYSERPAQEIDEDLDQDRGFFVGYRSPAGEQIGVYVVWSEDANQFFLYQDGREIHDRACTWLESGIGK